MRVGVSVGDVVGVVVVKVLWRRCDDVRSCGMMSGCDGVGDGMCLLCRRCDWRGLGCCVIGGSGVKFTIGENVAQILRSAVGDGELSDGDYVSLSVFQGGEGYFVWGCPDVLLPKVL